MFYPHEHSFWLDYDKHWLESCDCVLRLPGDSKGADQEMQWAIEMDKPVYLDIESLLKERNGKTIR
jgi:hypothetical protein